MYRVISVGKLQIAAVFVLLGLCLGLAAHYTAMTFLAMGQERYPDLYFARRPRQVQQEGKVCYLTFDDGPSQYTRQILQVLEEEGVQATFFVTGGQGLLTEEEAADLIRQEAEAGHTVGLHSYSHRYGEIYRSMEDYLADLEQIYRLVLQASGQRCRIVRFPGGSNNTVAPGGVMAQLREELDRRGFVYHDWNAVSGDDVSPAPAAGRLAGNILDAAGEREQMVALFHDGATGENTAEAVRLVIRQLKAEGYRFLPITDSTPACHLRTAA